ncbi:sulfur oxidation c-type cytochrome SoxA [Lacisediminimonas sp.]|uniref:sulfur oxidation c-type cytochrome SoxA n=1 Tax=Lacisediminimonas sp. TaxID=3060582 RepID=UPI002726810D|nr:sulfur oxidation c-type cytochrome SoxA [Lacisediminimonas sp.]MDO8298206.1 sulfur oxidation c-type cytochrome SoxA [Lacisediminimonas sp.]
MLLLLLWFGQVLAQSADGRLPGSAFMGPATQAMQRDDTQNPAMLWVKGGEALWRAPAGTAQKSCAACHGQAEASMRGVAARFPAFDAVGKVPVNLGQRINLCRSRHQQAPPWKLESDDLLGMESYLALQSRGMAVAPPADERLKPFVARGREQYFARIGQLNLSCAQCHDQQAGKRLGSALIPQGHASGYPVYRLEWQGMGSLQRRLRNCMNGVRALPHAAGAVELVELELYLAGRGGGMVMEAPGVRP